MNADTRPVKALCSDCEFKRFKLHDIALIECKHPALASGAGDVLGQMQAFVRCGSSSEFFIVRADVETFQRSRNTAWPLQFEPRVIGQCEGFKAC